MTVATLAPLISCLWNDVTYKDTEKYSSFCKAIPLLRYTLHDWFYIRNKATVRTFSVTIWCFGNNLSRPQLEVSTYLFVSYVKAIVLSEQLQIFDTHGSVHRRLLSRNTNKMQLCNGIYYSKVYWRLSMFRVTHRSSSGALNYICSLWFIYPCGDRPLPRLCLGNGSNLGKHYQIP
jgi:hypothetical protein